ncbi:MAG: cytidylate kinase-like family protein [Clostridia bacterium]|nr:cytidylate kinase-like family protein [Clostridia bacterium]
MSKNNVVITIARQYGSGGREVGELVAKDLNMEYHDKSLINLAAEKSGMNPEILKNADEKATPSFLYSIAVGSIGMVPFSYGMPYDTPINDKLFVLQSQIIEEEAEKSDSVFVGRCADFVLKDFPKVVRVFIYADIEKRAERIAKRKDISLGEAKNMAVKIDKKRANYYNYYTTLKWGKSENYDLMIDTSRIGIEGAAKLIEEYVKIIK